MTTNEIAIRENKGLAGFAPQTLVEAIELARMISKSGLVPDKLRGKPEDTLIVMMTGRELGLMPMQSLREINVIQGKGVASADLLAGLVLASPVCELFRVVESNDDSAMVEAKRVGWPDAKTIGYTTDDAEKAGLLGKDNWRKNKSAMLIARAKTRAARTWFPDVVGGFYSPDEADEILARAESTPLLSVETVATTPAATPSGPTPAQRMYVAAKENESRTTVPAAVSLAIALDEAGYKTRADVPLEKLDAVLARIADVDAIVDAHAIAEVGARLAGTAVDDNGPIDAATAAEFQLEAQPAASVATEKEIVGAIFDLRKKIEKSLGADAAKEAFGVAKSEASIGRDVELYLKKGAELPDGKRLATKAELIALHASLAEIAAEKMGKVTA